MKKKTNQFIVKMGGISGLRSHAVVLHAELLYENESYAAALELLRHGLQVAVGEEQRALPVEQVDVPLQRAPSIRG